MKYIYLLIMCVLLSSGVYANVLLSDQGAEVRQISTGNLLESGNLTISIYEDSEGGSALYSQYFPNAIINGSWNVMITPDLQYGRRYWKDYEINEQNLDFDGEERVEFQSSLGMINDVSMINWSLINSCPEGSAIRLIYANGTVECESSGNGSIVQNLAGLNAVGPYLSNDTSSVYFNESMLNQTIDSRSQYANGTGLELSGRVFTLITTCANDQVLRWNSASSSWICSDDYTENIDFSDYALKNQSESFNGNLTVLETGFFQVLGSITQRITRLFVTDISVANNIDVGGNVTAIKFIGDGSSLTGLPEGMAYTHLSNLTDDLGDRGYTELSNFTNNLGFINASQLEAYNETGLANAINNSLSTSKLDANDQRYNESARITSLNESLLTQLNAIIATNGSFNQTLTDALYASGIWNYNQTIAANQYANLINESLNSRINNLPLGNSSFNQTLTDNLYASNTWNYNQTAAAIESANAYTNTLNASQSNWVASTFVKINDILLNYFNRSEIEQGYYNKSEIQGFGFVNASGLDNYNETSLIQDVNTTLSAQKLDTSDQRYNDTILIGLVNASLSTQISAIQGENSSFNQTLTNSLYAGAQWGYNQTIAANNYTNQVNVTQTNWITITFLKITDAVSQYFNKTDIQAWYYNKSQIDAFGFVNSSELNSYNETTYINTIISQNNASWTSTYNATYAANSVNASWNESRATDLYELKPIFQQTSEDLKTTNNVVFNQTLFTLPVRANRNYTIECILWQVSATGATGVRINTTVPNDPLNFNLAYLSPTTATANSHVYCSGIETSCISTANAGLTTGLPNYINGRLENGNNAGEIIVNLRSEISGNLVTVKRGSYCRVTEE